LSKVLIKRSFADPKTRLANAANMLRNP